MDKESGEILPRDHVLELRKKGKNLLKKVVKKKEKQELELQEASQWVHYKEIGDTLLIEASEIPKGAKEWEIINAHSGEIMTIKLNPKCDALRNSELYFKKAKKGKRGLELCEERMDETLTYLKIIENFIEWCSQFLQADPLESSYKKQYDEIFATFNEHIKSEELGQQQGKKKKNEIKIPYRSYQIDGWQVYIGKNTTQNDEISTKFSKPSDIWLHVAGHAGSHCIIRRAKGMDRPPHYVVEKTAALAVWFSKAKHTSYADVNVTEARYVRKRRKAPPGEVIAEQCKTIRVAPLSPQEMFGKDD